MKSSKEVEEFMDQKCVNERGYHKVKVLGSKTAYYDTINRVLWWKTSQSKKPVIKAVKNASSVRFNNAILKDRFD